MNSCLVVRAAFVETSDSERCIILLFIMSSVHLTKILRNTSRARIVIVFAVVYSEGPENETHTKEKNCIKKPQNCCVYDDEWNERKMSC
ncbi:hypothetical protein TNCT_401151 [Trichonephila clavata]|uniref:Uncharacterized protein n=1 Tax=Trichonephila clavata TaxID=2740835 RepID=A0A8X6HMZ8_TRICU|nr:hypothetical protein TNCT_401151 [Trichonephila clavata]